MLRSDFHPALSWRAWQTPEDQCKKILSGHSFPEGDGSMPVPDLTYLTGRCGAVIYPVAGPGAYV